MTEKIDNFYDGREEARFRLSGTIVEYDGNACLVRDVEEHEDGVLRLRIEMLPLDRAAIRQQGTRKLINSPKFRRFQPVGVGWCNDFDNGRRHATWIERVPVRRSKQGLSSEAYTYSTTGQNVAAALTRGGLNFENAYYSVAFTEMVRNEYPDFDEALAKLIPNTSIAVSRDWLLAKDVNYIIYIRYRRDVVGIIVRNNIHLFARFAYLIDTLVACSHMPDNAEIGV